MLTIIIIAMFCMIPFALYETQSGGGGGGISGPGAILGGIGSLVQGISGDAMSLFANVLNAQQREQAMGMLGQIGPESQVYQDLLQKSQAHIGDIAQNSQQAMGLYQDAVARAGAGGVQERKDINTQFDSVRSAAQADLTSRGLMATSVAPGVTGSIERNRADALGGLDARLRQERFGFDMGGINLGQQLFSQGLNSTFALQQYPFQMQQDDIMRRLSLLSGFNNFGPDPGLTANINSALGAGAVQPAQANSPDLVSPALFGGLAGTAGTFGTLGLLGGFGGVTGEAALAGLSPMMLMCIDEKARIEMADGTTLPLKDIRKGDVVMGASRKARRVVNRDTGPQVVKRLHIRLVFDDTDLIVDTLHLVFGKPAGDWQVYDEIDGRILKKIELAQPERTGDLLLENGDGYIANGIPVASMFAHHGVTEKYIDALHGFEERHGEVDSLDKLYAFQAEMR